MVRMWRPLVFLLLMTLANGQSLKDQIDSAVAGFSGSVSIFAKNLDTGETFARRADEKTRTASTIKVAILAAVFAAVAEGKVKWTDRVELRAADKVSGSGVLAAEFADGDQLPLSDLAHLMIVMSDNTATNLILDRIGADYVNALMDKLGLKEIRSLRKIRGDGANLKAAEGFSAAGRDPANARFGIGSSTPREMVELLEKIERGQVVSPAASREMLNILKRQQDRNGIPRKLGQIPVANKTGALDRLRSDVGIVYSPGGRIAMAITCDDLPETDWSADNPALLLIARLARILTSGLARGD
jgi:beta-lactamase class A